MMQQLQQQRRAKERAVGEAHLEWNAELQRKREQDARPPSRSALFALSVKDGVSSWCHIVRCYDGCYFYFLFFLVFER